MQKYLIFVPDLKKPGGVANYYSAVHGKFNLNVDYFIRGTRKFIIPVPGVLIYLIDYLRFFIILLQNKYSLYIINTSFAKVGCMRDAVFIVMCLIFGKRFVVFFRGWDSNYEKTISNKYNRFPFKVFLKANSIIVLAKEFGNKIQSWGYQGKILYETTIVDNELIKDFQKKELVSKQYYESKIQLLFMARVVKEKGIYLLVDTVSKLNGIKNRNFQLVIAGSGKDLSELKKYVSEKQLNNVIFAGYVEGEKKKVLLKEADVFFFPTMHGEGMPNSVLEAMAFGLPIITRPIGGVKDFFEQNKMGILTDSTKPEDFATIITGLISDKVRMKEISEYNYDFAQKNFTTEVVINRLEKIFTSI